MPSLEVLESKIDYHEDECLRHKTLVISRIEKIEAGLEAMKEGKVSYKQFYWIIGILVTILISTVGYLIQQGNSLLSKIDDVGRTAVSTKIDVSELKGKLDPYQVEFQK